MAECFDLISELSFDQQTDQLICDIVSEIDAEPEDFKNFMSALEKTNNITKAIILWDKQQ